MASGEFAGKKFDASWLEFPAAATKTVPSPVANWIASSMDCELGPPLHDALITSAPLLAA
jgi:hypothetical protein